MNTDSTPTHRPFDLEKARTRTLDTTSVLLKLVLIPSEAAAFAADPEAQHRWSQRLRELTTDALEATGEVARLYAQFRELQRRHMPIAGEPGAAAMCSSCSLHGAQVPWPCEVYNFAGKALPLQP